MNQHNIFDRLESLIGKKGLEKIRQRTILVIGIGGVGGYVVESLIRSGISKIIIVDPDIIEETNINRQIIALNSTIGQKKVDVMEYRIKDINNTVKVIKYDCFFNQNTKDKILSHDIDFIVDCCDMLKSKQLLIKESLNRKIPLISSMGTANRLDPSRLAIMDIRKTYNDPLARKIRKFIKDEKVTEKIMVLTSLEMPKKNGRILGSTSFVPSSAGLLIASYIIRKIIE
ncbi:MAG: tRNA threonylcarbamoyladenosine dehydratase [Bacilli bacterium]|nr:tRNA threonylcarbamoyladenosine dehydratase [Bacilli bacterium]